MEYVTRWRRDLKSKEPRPPRLASQWLSQSAHLKLVNAESFDALKSPFNFLA